jgi:hypothetical protein
MIVHQIFLKVSNKTINDYQCYLNGWEYRLHTEIDESIMTEEELDILSEGSKRYPFFAVDYYRYIFLSKYGGMYVDLDVSPTDKFIEIKDQDIIIGRTVLLNNKYYINNNIIKLTPELNLKLKNYTNKEFNNKKKIKVYDIRKKRFFLQTVGCQMFSRFCKLNKITYLDNYDDYFIDYSTISWDKF